MTLTADMNALLDAFYASLESGDASPFLDTFAPDILIVGTDAAEWFKGRAEAQRVVGAQFDEMRSAGARVPAVSGTSLKATTSCGQRTADHAP
jgi:hypothetical protein